MLIDKINYKYPILATNCNITTNVLVNPLALITFEMEFNHNGRKYHLSLMDELINFLPLFYFPLDQDEWDCIVMLDYMPYLTDMSGLRIIPKIKKGYLSIEFENLNIIFNFTELMFSQYVLGNTIYNSLVEQAKYIEE